jgi:hypothetical protein
VGHDFHVAYLWQEDVLPLGVQFHRPVVRLRVCERPRASILLELRISSVALKEGLERPVETVKHVLRRLLAELPRARDRPDSRLSIASTTGCTGSRSRSEKACTRSKLSSAIARIWDLARPWPGVEFPTHRKGGAAKVTRCCDAPRTTSVIGSSFARIPT